MDGGNEAPRKPERERESGLPCFGAFIVTTIRHKGFSHDYTSPGVGGWVGAGDGAGDGAVVRRFHGGWSMLIENIFGGGVTKEVVSTRDGHYPGE